MSTRAVYTFKDKRNIVHVFKHHDGYPGSAVEHIRNALRIAWKLPRFEADEFAASFVAANKGKLGGGIRLCGTHVQEPHDAYVDVNYWYVITCRGEPAYIMVNIYTVNWSSVYKSQDLIYSGPLDDAMESLTELWAAQEE